MSEVIDIPATNVVAFDPNVTQTEMPAESPKTDSAGLFKVSRAAFQRQLALAVKVAGTSKTLPILSCAMLRFGAGKLTVEATNLDIFAESTVPAETSGEFAIAIPAKVLAQFVAKCSSDYLMAEVKGLSLFISDIENRTTIMGMSDSEWPGVGKTADNLILDISGEALARSILDVEKAASDDETRYVLQSIALAFDKKGGVVTVATDGRRLMKAEVQSCAPKIEDKVMILPIFSSRVIAGSVPREVPAMVYANKDRSRLAVSSEAPGFSYRLATRLVDANYPNYAQVIPKAERTVYRANRIELVEAMARINVLTSEKASVVITAGKDLLTLSLSNVSLGNGREPVVAKGGTAEEITAAFNPKFLMDTLCSWTDETVTLDLADGVSPLVLMGSGKIAVIMPVRLS